MVYRMNDVNGWPRISATMTARDFWGNDVVAGYGVIHLPTTPGSHTRYMQMFKPKTSSTFFEVLGWLGSAPAEYKTPIEILQKGQGREVTRVESVGIVKIKFNISTRNMEAFGF